MFDINVDKPSLTGKLIETINVHFGGGRDKLPDDAQRIVDRFQRLLDGHGIDRARLIDMTPPAFGWSLANLSDPRQLLEVLTPDARRWLAETFGVLPEWLAGRGDRIYDWPMGYKRPEQFVQTLAEWGWHTPQGKGSFSFGLRMTILAADYRRQNGPLRQFVIVFSHPLREWDNGERTVYRHAVFETVMTWDHEPCQMDALILARWFSQSLNRYQRIPIVPVPREAVLAIGEGRALPGEHIPWGFGGHDSLEDRVLIPGNPISDDNPGESLVAVPSDKLSRVMAYVREHGLARDRCSRGVS